MKRSTAIIAVLLGCIGLVSIVLLLFRGSADVEGTLFVAVQNTATSQTSVEALNLTIKNIELWDADQGWISVLEDEQIVDILDLPTPTELSQVYLPVGSFQRMRLEITAVEVTLPATDTTEATTHNAALLSQFISFDLPVTIQDDEETSVLFDIAGADSLYTTITGSRAFIPYITVRTFTNTDLGQLDELTTITAEPTVTGRFGMNSAGAMQEGYRLPRSARLEERGGSIIITQPSPKQETFFETTQPQEQTTLSDVPVLE